MIYALKGDPEGFDVLSSLEHIVDDSRFCGRLVAEGPSLPMEKPVDFVTPQPRGRSVAAGKSPVAPDLYFAYGSNLNLQQMRRRCPSARPLRAYSVANWRLVFRSVADIEPCQGYLLCGALYRVRERDVAALDRYEGVRHGLYRRDNVRLADTGEVAFVYRMNDTAIFPPGPDYLAGIAQGYDDWRLPKTHLDAAAKAASEWLHRRRLAHIDRIVPEREPMPHTIMFQDWPHGLRS